MTEHFSEISSVIREYFDGLYFSDSDLLREVFHPLARYSCATDDTFTNLSMEEYFPIVDGRTSPASLQEPRRDSIESIELAGPNTAFVRAHCAIGPKYFTDMLTFVKTDGRWRIIAKVFHYERQTQ